MSIKAKHNKILLTIVLILLLLLGSFMLYIYMVYRPGLSQKKITYCAFTKIKNPFLDKDYVGHILSNRTILFPQLPCVDPSKLIATIIIDGKTIVPSPVPTTIVPAIESHKQTFIYTVVAKNLSTTKYTLFVTTSYKLWIQDSAFRSYLKSNHGVPVAFDKTDSLNTKHNDITKLTDINVNFANIHSLDGIEYFIGLKNLKCYGNKISNLNLKHNTQLRYLDCGNNLFTALDLHNLKNLVYIDCWNGSITKINLDGCNSLRWLNCRSNNFTSLNLRDATSFWFLDCWNNKLTSLDVSKNLQLKFLNCGANRTLQSLNIEANKKLKTLYIDKAIVCNHPSIALFKKRKGTMLYNATTLLFRPIQKVSCNIQPESKKR